MPATLSPPANATQWATFPTKLGWMALAGNEQGVLGLAFGYHSPRAALSHLSHVTLGSDVASGDDGWCSSLVSRLTAYAEGEPDDFGDVAVDDSYETSFGRKVIEQCRRIAPGDTLTYGQLATLSGSPRAARAVGNVMAKNRTPIIVPCHRVVPAGGKLGRYSAGGGTRMKLRLLEAEARACSRS